MADLRLSEIKNTIMGKSKLMSIQLGLSIEGMELEPQKDRDRLFKQKGVRRWRRVLVTERVATAAEEKEINEKKTDWQIPSSFTDPLEHHKLRLQ